MVFLYNDRLYVLFIIYVVLLNECYIRKKEGLGLMNIK